MMPLYLHSSPQRIVQIMAWCDGPNEGLTDQYSSNVAIGMPEASRPVACCFPTFDTEKSSGIVGSYHSLGKKKWLRFLTSKNLYCGAKT
jgi:hypothetical protein